MDKQNIVLGSGKVYVTEFADAIPGNAAIEAEENLLGLISGGASIEYTSESYEASDDLGLVKKVIMTSEEALLKLGLVTWTGETLQKLTETARVTEEGTVRTVKIGGVQNANGKKYVVHFVHKDAIDGDVRVTIVGTNQAGFTLTFQKDAETVINPEFKALPLDGEGTLIIYQEEIIEE